MASRSPSPSRWRWPSFSKQRRVTLLAADLLLLTSVLTTLLLQYIPSSLLYPVWGLAKMYAIYLQVLIPPCLFGIWGAIKESPLPAQIFATTLILDAIISLPPRLLLLASLIRAPAVCEAPGTPHSVIWTRCADAAIGPICVVLALVVLSGLEGWGGSWIRRWSLRLREEQRRAREREREMGEEMEEDTWEEAEVQGGGKGKGERFRDEV